MAAILKVVLLGESGVGKTSIINMFTSGKYDPDVGSSLSAQFTSKTIEFKDLKRTIKFDIWDTAGQEKYRSLAKIFYKEAKVIGLCYDITNKTSFIELKNYWYEHETKTSVDGNPIFAVIGNKNDLYERKQVSDEEGKAFAKEINAIFQVTSAKTDSGINLLFENIGKKYFNPDFDCNEEENKQKQEYEQKKNEKTQNRKPIQTNSRGGRQKLSVEKAKKDTSKKGCC